MAKYRVTVTWETAGNEDWLEGAKRLADLAGYPADSVAFDPDRLGCSAVWEAETPIELRGLFGRLLEQDWLHRVNMDVVESTAARARRERREAASDATRMVLDKMHLARRMA